jgi:flagellar motor component MotA
MKQLSQFIKQAVYFSKKSRQEGFLALNDDINNIDDSQGKCRDIFKFGLQLALDGTNPTCIYKILSNMIALEQDEEVKKLKEIQRDAALMLQAGYSVRLFLLNFMTFLNYDERTALEEELLKDDFDLYGIESSKPRQIKTMAQSEFLEQTADVIIKAYNFSKKARKEGLLALEDELENINDELFKQGLHLTVDGVDDTVIANFISNTINTEKDTVTRRLQTIIKDAVLGIQEGDNAELLVHKLISHIDNSELKTVTKILLDIDVLKQFNIDKTVTLEKGSVKFSEQAADVIYRAYMFSEKTAANNFLSLKNDIDKSKYARRDIFEYGIQLIADGANLQTINGILSNLITQEQNEETLRLKIIQKEAVLGIQKGEKYAPLLHVLISHLTDDELEEVLKLFSGSFSQKFRELLENPFINKEAADKALQLCAAGLESSIGAQDAVNFFYRTLNFSAGIDPTNLADLIKKEQPQTIAFFLALAAAGTCSAGGIQTAVDILKLVNPAVEKQVMEPIEADDPELAGAITQYLIINK